MRNAKSAKKTKMADEGRVSVNSKQTVLRIHEKLKKEVHQIAEKKSWTAEQKDEFEKKLLELYKDSVEETIKENVAIGGQEWESVNQSEVSNSSVAQEEMEPLNRDRLTQVLAICSDLEDLIRDTSRKRKKYPQQIVEGVNSILQSRKEMLENYQSTVKNDSSLSDSNVITPDFKECIQRLQAASSDLTQLSKSFPELHGKADRLRQAVQSHKAMQECETDGVLFATDSNDKSSNSSPLVLHDDQTSESLNLVEFKWWGSDKRKSNPPRRYDASKNTYNR